MNKMQMQVAEFQYVMNQPCPTSPTRLTPERKNFRMGLLLEELTEYVKANNIIDEADALADILYIVFGTAVEHGLNMQPIVDIVQNANMAKLWEDGKPRFNEIGKVIKPPSWEAPEALIELEVMRQIEGK
jgi:predicted HAD superfamily Cof-like phosphohydrolase